MKNILLILFILGTTACTGTSQIKNKVEETRTDIDIYTSIDQGNISNIKAYTKMILKENKDIFKDVLIYFAKKDKTEKDKEIFNLLLKLDKELTFTDEENKDIVKILIEKGSYIDLELLKILDKYSFDFKKIDFEGNNYLISAIDYSYNETGLKFIKFLLEKGLDPNHKNIDNYSPLSYLLTKAYKGLNKDILKLLLEYGLDINQKMGKNNESALIWICSSINNLVDISLLDIILENGGDPNQTSSEGFSPLSVLILNENMPDKRAIANKLIDNGADVNYIDLQGKSPLVYITLNLFQFENQNLLPIIIGNGGNLDYRDSNGNSLLTYASSYGSYVIYYNYMKLLLNLGMNPNIENVNKETPLITISKNENSGFIAASLLYNYGANVNAKDIYGNTALSYAVMLYKGEREKNIIDYLAVHGIDFMSENNEGYNPLMLAIYYAGQENGIEALTSIIPYYKDLNFKSSFDYSPLMVASHYSAKTSSVEAVKILVERGADVNLVQKDGTSPLMLAAIHSNSLSSFETVKTLIALGANPDLEIKNEWIDEEHNIIWKKGDTALDLAKKYLNITSNEETIKYLEEITRKKGKK
jgi:ankyrin repeat protein